MGLIAKIRKVPFDMLRVGDCIVIGRNYFFKEDTLYTIEPILSTGTTLLHSHAYIKTKDCIYYKHDHPHFNVITVEPTTKRKHTRKPE
jgi:hypothetical protein